MKRTVDEGEDSGARQEEYYCFQECILLFWGFTSCADSISEEVAGFSPFMVSPIKKNCVHCLMCLIAVLVVLSVKILT